MKTTLLAGAALALVTSVGAAQGYGPGMMGPLGLNLSDEQQAKIFAMQEAQRRNNFDTMSKMRSEMFSAAAGVQRREH
jgi:hypothetical protein